MNAWLSGTILLVASVALSPCQDVIPNLEGIVDQRDYEDSANGCAPASLLNLLKFSDPEYRAIYDSYIGSTDGARIRSVVNRYFKGRPSVVYPDQRRWGVHGIQSADLVTGLNEVLADHDLPPLNGTYLDRGEEETRAAHIKRCHDLISTSLNNGVRPILGFRSYIVRRREKNGMEPAWEAGFFHNVVVHSILRPPSYTGFEVTVLEPYRGIATSAYLHREGNRQAFRALKGLEKEENWLDGEPFLQIVAPDLPTVRPLDLKWSDRIVIAATFLIGDF